MTECDQNVKNAAYVLADFLGAHLSPSRGQRADEFGHDVDVEVITSTGKVVKGTIAAHMIGGLLVEEADASSEKTFLPTRLVLIPYVHILRVEGAWEHPDD